MASYDRPAPPAERVKILLKEQFEKFKKTPYTIPVAVAVTAALYYYMLAYMSTSCLVGLLPPLLLFGMLWKFDIKRVRKLLVIGLVTATIVMGVGTVFLVQWFQAQEVNEARSVGDNPVLVNGTVEPVSGGENTPFTYSLTVDLPNASVVVTDVRVNITSLGNTRSEPMTLFSQNETLLEDYYIYTTTLTEPINQFYFAAIVNGTWVEATDYIDGEPVAVAGPISDDEWALAVPIIKYVMLYQAYLQFFAIYAILCGMVWWMRRARRMREQAVERWEEKRKEMEAEEPKEESRVPSLSKAMGLESEDETFVCSECGADVPADAKTCPTCGEKFD